MLNRLWKAGWNKWIAFIGAWAILSLVLAPETYLFFLFRGQPIPWKRTLALTFTNASIAFVFLPLIVWLTRRYPLERRNWQKNFFFCHLPASVLFSVLHSWLYWMLCYAVHEISSILFLRFQPNLMTYWAIVAFTQAVDYFRRYTEREKQLAQAELLLLKSQLQPHFLFNTLNTVSAMMHEDVHAADEMVDRLSQLLRLMLDQVGAHEVTLRQELQFLGTYMAIQQTRFPDKLQLRIDIDPNTLEALVPNMLLQPIVENSIRHGLDLNRNGGTIEVQARRSQDQLLLNISDDGRGILPGSEIKEGMGLTNTRLRLQQLYESNFSMKMESNNGFRIELAIPFRTEVAAEGNKAIESYEPEDPRFGGRRRTVGAKSHNLPA